MHRKLTISVDRTAVCRCATTSRQTVLL